MFHKNTRSLYSLACDYRPYGELFLNLELAQLALRKEPPMIFNWILEADVDGIPVRVPVYHRLSIVEHNKGSLKIDEILGSGKVRVTSEKHEMCFDLPKESPIFVAFPTFYPTNILYWHKEF